jgi:putative oxidoreductase
MTKTSVSKIKKLHDRLVPSLQDLFLLIFRIHWGFAFIQTGYGKFIHFERTRGFFESLQIPFPSVNVLMAASTELFGGALILLGLGAYIVPIPVIFTMLVAYGTAHPDGLKSLLDYPNIDPFLQAEPFMFLLTAVIVFLFGPGRLSVDYLLGKKGHR